VNVRRRLTTAAVALALPVLTAGLSGCGFDAPTDQRYNPAVGVNHQDGTVDALNVLVVSSSDGSGALVASFANNNQQEADRLTAGTGEGVQVEVSGDTEIPAGGLLNLSDGSMTITGERVVPGNFVRVTFSFENASSVSVRAPVVAHSFEGPYADVPTS
jgi:hypothetical protein